MKRYIWLQTIDGSVRPVEEDVAMVSPFLLNQIVHENKGGSENCAILLPKNIGAANLDLILDYCRFHQASGRSDKERKNFDKKFVRLDAQRLIQLSADANSLTLMRLAILTKRAAARILSENTSKQLKEALNNSNDLDEVVEVDNAQVKQGDNQKNDKNQNSHMNEELVNEPSIDELVEFINNSKKDSHGLSKSQKRRLRKKIRQKDQTSKKITESHAKMNNSPSSCHLVKVKNVSEGSSSGTTNIHLQDSHGTKTSKNRKRHKRRNNQYSSLNQSVEEHNKVDGLSSHGVITSLQEIRVDDDHNSCDDKHPKIVENDRIVREFAKKLNLDYNLLI